MTVEDVQSRPDGRCIDLDQVGVSDLRYPIIVLDRDQERQQPLPLQQGDQRLRRPQSARAYSTRRA